MNEAKHLRDLKASYQSQADLSNLHRRAHDNHVRPRHEAIQPRPPSANRPSPYEKRLSHLRIDYSQSY